MSFKAMDWAASADVDTAQQRVCLLLLAWHLSDVTGLCCPSQRAIAREARISLRAAQYALSQLEQKGLISRRLQKNELGVVERTNYVLSIPAQIGQGVSHDVQDVSHGVQEGVAQDATGCRTTCMGVSHTVHGGVAQGATKQGIEHGNEQGKEHKDTRASRALLKKPDDVTPAVWKEWVTYKRRISKSCTQRMVDSIVSEAHKAGMTTEKAMTTQIERGWRGFQAEWVKNQNHRFTSSGRPLAVTETEEYRQRLQKACVYDPNEPDEPYFK